MDKAIRKFFVLLLIMLFLFPLWIGNGILYSEEELLISLDFDNTEIRDILRVLAEQHNLNIIVSDEVKGEVTVHLDQVRLENALRVILGTEDFGYLKRGNIIEVGSLERLKSLKEAEDEAVLGTTTEIFYLKYVNAEEIEKVVKSLLSSKGSTTVYYSTIRSGWPVGGIGGEATMGVVPRTENKKEEFSRILIVRDFPEYLTKIRQLVEELDNPPKQVLIQTLIVEVSHDLTRDIGIDWTTLNKAGDALGDILIGCKGRQELSAATVGGTVTAPSAGFTGLTATYKRLKAPSFEAAINALEEKGKANILSNPKILVINGHEATILVGEKYPILTTDVSPETGAVTSESLAHYEPIGITLKVVPIIWEDGRVNMSIHPAVTELGDEVTGSFLTVNRITTRELDTNITVNSGETIVIGGLIKNKETVIHYKVPLIGDIPILGWLFRREKKVTEKMELLIFITPTIMDTPKLTEGERSSLEETSKKLKKEFGLRPKKLKEKMSR